MFQKNVGFAQRERWEEKGRKRGKSVKTQRETDSAEQSKVGTCVVGVILRISALF